MTFNINYDVVKGTEDWTKSVVIKVPKREELRASFKDITASELNPEKDFFYHNKVVDMEIESFSFEGSYFLKFNNPKDFPVYREKLIFADILQTKNILEEQIHSMFFTVDDLSYAVVNLGKSLEVDKGKRGYKYLSSVKDEFFSFFLRIYNERFALDEKFIRMLTDVSEELKDRTITVLNYKKPFQSNSGEIEFPEDNEIQGSFSFVISRSPDELLPYELTNHMLKERKLGRSDYNPFTFKREKGLVYAELTRLSVDKDNAPSVVAADIIKIATAAAKGHEIDEMVIYVDPFHKKLFKKFGFSQVEKYKDAFGETFYVMKSTPENVLNSVMEVYHGLEVDPDGLRKLIDDL